jgi:hypothetical protein
MSSFYQAYSANDATYSPPVAPDPVPDAVADKKQQRVASTLLNEKYTYETTTGNNYKFKSNQDYMLYKMGKLRQANVNTGAFPNAPMQSLVPPSYTK